MLAHWSLGDCRLRAYDLSALHFTSQTCLSQAALFNAQSGSLDTPSHPSTSSGTASWNDVVVSRLGLEEPALPQSRLPDPGAFLETVQTVAFCTHIAEMCQLVACGLLGFVSVSLVCYSLINGHACIVTDLCSLIIP